MKKGPEWTGQLTEWKTVLVNARNQHPISGAQKYQEKDRQKGDLQRNGGTDNGRDTAKSRCSACREMGWEVGEKKNETKGVTPLGAGGGNRDLTDDENGCKRTAKNNSSGLGQRGWKKKKTVSKTVVIHRTKKKEKEKGGSKKKGRRGKSKKKKRRKSAKKKRTATSGTKRPHNGKFLFLLTGAKQKKQLASS